MSTVRNSSHDQLRKAVLDAERRWPAYQSGLFSDAVEYIIELRIWERIAREEGTRLEALAAEVTTLRSEAETRESMDVWQELMVAQMVNEQLTSEIAAFRKAIVDGDGPSCEDVCQRSCIGVCGAAEEVNESETRG